MGILKVPQKNMKVLYNQFYGSEKTVYLGSLYQLFLWAEKTANLRIFTAYGNELKKKFYVKKFIPHLPI